MCFHKYITEHNNVKVDGAFANELLYYYFCVLLSAGKFDFLLPLPPVRLAMRLLNAMLHFYFEYAKKMTACSLYYIII